MIKFIIIVGFLFDVTLWKIDENSVFMQVVTIFIVQSATKISPKCNICTLKQNWHKTSQTYLIHYYPLPIFYVTILTNFHIWKSFVPFYIPFYSDAQIYKYVPNLKTLCHNVTIISRDNFGQEKSQVTTPDFSPISTFFYIRRMLPI